MKNGDEPAFPVTATEHLTLEKGLTKREYFAATVMQGILSNPKMDFRMQSSELAECAIELADALLAELEKPTDQNLESCPKCGNPRGKYLGKYICPCPHCGDEIPF